LNENGHVWHYRGHRLRQLEWGLWTALDESGRYFLCYRPHGRNGPVVRRWVVTDGVHLTVQDLRQMVRAVHARIQAEKLGANHHAPARPCLEAYLADLRRRNRSEKHVTGVRRSVERLLDSLNLELLDQISVQTVQTFLHELHTEGLAPRSLNKYRAHLSAWLGWAADRGQISENPVQRVGTAVQNVRYKPFPTPEQMTALVDASTCYDAGLWCLLAFTGLRRGSFLSLTAESFRPNGILVPRTKRRQEWWIDYDDGCPLWGADLSKLGQRVWATRKPTPAYLRFHFEKACKTAKLPDTITPHSLRHAFCSWLTMMGENLQDVAAWAHHATTATTERWYTHLRPRGRSRLADNRRSVFTMRSHTIEKALPAES